MKKIKEDEKCFYCEGKGKSIHSSDGKEHICPVCNGRGINFRALYKKRHQGKNRCKYCGKPCSDYACNSCLDSFEKENENEDID